jgi:hypothetical protein
MRAASRIAKDTAMSKFPRFASAGTTCVALALMLSVASAYQKDDKDKSAGGDNKPKLTLKAQPVMAIAPARVVFTAELIGGSNDNQEYYCPTVEWQWGDDTSSESNADCEPYQPGKSEIKRRFTMDHAYAHGGPQPLRVQFRLKRRDKTIVATSTNIQIRPGIRDMDQ